MTQPVSVVVVERDPHARALVARFLTEVGHRVELAIDGEQALALVREHQPDLVVCEILVPKLDGLALCRRLKANAETAHVLVLVLTILAASARAKEAGADGFMMKPLSQHRLIAMVQELIDQRSPAQQERS